jgi:anti-anti-sigma regulatory factor
MSSCKILYAECCGVYVLKLVGEVRLTYCNALDDIIESIVGSSGFVTLVVDLSEASMVDSTTLGLLAKLAIRARTKSHFLPSIVSSNPDITRVIKSMGFESIYIVLKEPVLDPKVLIELEPREMDEQSVRERVLEAHRILMEMNESNREMFRDLVTALEGEQGTAAGDECRCGSVAHRVG